MYRSLKLLMFLVLIYLIGLVAFIETLPFENTMPSKQVDVIAVLTGGTKRIDRGLGLLKEKQGKWLFISGVNRGVQLRTLVRASGYKQSYPHDKIILDYKARTTRENAIETKAFMDRAQLKSLLVVTADYHLWRTKLEINRYLGQNKEVYYSTVHPIDLSKRTWCKDYKLLCLYMVEFNKLIGATLRYMFWWGKNLT